MYASRIFFLLSVFAFLSLCKPIDMNAQTATRPDFAIPKLSVGKLKKIFRLLWKA